MITAPRIGALGAATALSLVLVACGDGGSMADHSSMASTATSSSASASPTGGAAVEADHNAQDTAFAQVMIVHHQGAVEMARLVATRTSNPQVEDLAATIEAAQQPEIEEMTSWLTTWGEPVTADSAMEGMDHSSPDPAMSHPAVDGSSTAPMTNPEQMTRLQDATGVDADRMFLQMMIEHHEGAIAMAETEQQQGRNTRALGLADSIVVSQNAEIEQMTQVLAALD